jgi:hypothetical protein
MTRCPYPVPALGLLQLPDLLPRAAHAPETKNESVVQRADIITKLVVHRSRPRTDTHRERTHTTFMVHNTSCHAQD